jgi:hypothetical protein
MKLPTKDRSPLGGGVVDQLKFRNYGQRVHEFHGGASVDDTAI